MRVLLALLTTVVFLLATSCSDPEGTVKKKIESESVTENTSISPFADLDATGAAPGEAPTTRTLAEPNLEPTGPVHESPGIVDNREAQVALDLLKMEDGEAKFLALTELFRRWAEDDLDAAMEFLPYVEKDIEPKRSFFRGVAPQLLEHDPERLLEVTNEHWWQGQWGAYAGAMRKVADTNLDFAVEFFTRAGEEKQAPTLAEEIAAQLMDNRSFEEAEAFALSMERPEARAMAIQGMVKRWVIQDPVAASIYVDQLSDPGMKDYAIRGLIYHSAVRSPEESLAWAKTMKEGEVRTSAVSYLVRRWNSPDHRANLEDLAAFRGLSEEERGIIREALGE